MGRTTGPISSVSGLESYSASASAFSISSSSSSSATSSLPFLITFSKYKLVDYFTPQNVLQQLAEMGSKAYDVENGERGPTNVGDNMKTFPLNSISNSELDCNAKWMCKDPDLWVFRRFGRLHLFNVLCLQRQLTQLEEDVKRLMWENDEKGIPTSLETQKAVQEQLPNIRRTLEDYDNALAHLAAMNSYCTPYEHIVRHVKSWSGNSGYNVLPRELDIVDEIRLKDLASVATGGKQWIHRFIDNHQRLRRIFETKESRNSRTAPTDTMLYSEVNIRRTERFVMNSTFCILLLCPVVALVYVNNKAWKLVILVMFVFGASMLTSSLSDAADLSSLAVVAGYSAILVVFLSNNIGS